MVQFGNEWDEIMKGEFDKEYYVKLREFLKTEYFSREIYPDMYNIFNAMKTTSYSDVKAVILGQDPYHEPGQAHGLCFSVKKGTEAPPSLRNIFKELYDDLGIPPAHHGELTKWAENGVLLLNTVLTVRRGEANSHKGMGWEIFTDNVIKKLNEREKPMVFLLWGAPAKRKRELITNPAHLVLMAAHPSPLSAYNGYFGCRHFSKCNEFLAAHGMEPIDWRLE
ncbi:MAG: uracil-DNA glycosylase [Oscillospiraceae bacterium]|nr:uracil-DNA glycosylase [Oscillospiraceae bacterium]MDY2847712.1 uracil-DNA glycosylase [Oscillospiraceae bacterium]